MFFSRRARAPVPDNDGREAIAAAINAEAHPLTTARSSQVLQFLGTRMRLAFEAPESPTPHKRHVVVDLTSPHQQSGPHRYQKPGDSAMTFQKFFAR